MSPSRRVVLLIVSARDHANDHAPDAPVGAVNGAAAVARAVELRATDRADFEGVVVRVADHGACTRHERNSHISAALSTGVQYVE